MVNNSPERLRDAYKIAALVVAQYGDAYLPVFERLHQEMERENQKRYTKQLALDVAAAFDC